MFAMVEAYPLGNGLGGGGTSIPYFLQSLLQSPVEIENEYGRIALEQGIPGLALWLAFIVWLFTRAAPRRDDPWFAGRWLARLFCAISFATAPLGTGLLNAVPQTALVLLFAGWIAAPQAVGVRRSFAVRRATLSGAVPRHA
jgi:O-antigen ligase